MEERNGATRYASIVLGGRHHLFVLPYDMTLDLSGGIAGLATQIDAANRRLCEMHVDGRIRFRCCEDYVDGNNYVLAALREKTVADPFSVRLSEYAEQSGR